MRALVTAIVSGALLGSVLTPAAGNGPLPAPSAAYPMSEPGQTVAGRMGAAPPVQVSVALDEVARAGGRGSVTIALTRRATPGPALRDLRVRITTPPRTSLRSAAGPGWSCRRAVCVRDTAVAGIPPIHAVFDVRRAYRRPTARISAKASWVGGPRGQRDTVSSAVVQVHKPLRVSLSSPAGPRVSLTTHDGAASRQFLLAGRIRGIGGAQVDARWRQLSGPRASMLHARRVHAAKQRVGQVVQVPNTAGDARYRFALIVDANGQKVTRTVVVRTRLQRQLGTVDGNNAQLRELAAASRRPELVRPHTGGIGNRLRLRAEPGFTVPAGQRTRVRIQTRRKVAGVRWQVDGTAAGNGRAVRVSAPDTVRAARIVTARVRLRNGTTITESALVRSGAGQPLLQAAAPSDWDRAELCSVADEAARHMRSDEGDELVELDLGGKYTLQIAAENVTEDDGFRDDQQDCTGSGELAFEQATLLRGRTVQLLNTIGSLGATGLTISKAGWALPETFRAVAPVTSIPLAADQPVTAALKDGKWGLPSGELTVQPFAVAGKKIYALSFVPLPGDWTFTPGRSTVSFLNSSKATPDVADGTMRYSQQAAGSGASVQMAVDSVDDQWDRLDVDVANASLGQTASGATIMAAGRGSLDLGNRDRSSIDIAISCQGGGDNACEIVQDLFVQDFRLTWNTKVMGVVGTLAVQYGTPAKQYTFGLRGAYAGPGDWSVDAVSAADWDLGTTGLQAVGLAGSMGMKPTAADPDRATFQAQFTGGVRGFRTERGVSVSRIAASLSNMCPQADAACSPGAIRLTVSMDLTAQLPGSTTPAALSTNTAINLTTMAFRFDFGFQDVRIGPDALNVRRAQFIMTNEDTGTCRAQGQSTDPPATGVYTLQVLAQARILDADVAVGGSVDADGYCIWGRPGTIDLGTVGQTRSQIFGYTNLPNGAGLRLPTGEKVTLKAGRMQISGSFALPDDIQKAFKIPAGQLGYVASYTNDDKGLSFDLLYTPTEAVSVYSTDRARLSLTGISLGISVVGSSKSATLRLAADGALFVKGGAGTPDSTTPLGMSASFTFGPRIEATFQAGVVTDGGKVDNAFGQPGLTVRQLAASFTLVLPQPTGSIAFNADVTLPQEWVRSVGVQPGTREALAIALSETTWCMAIELGQESTANTAVAVDLANRGFLTAGYFKLVIAPTGCDVPVGAADSKRIAPGFGFAFVGHIAGAALIASINATWQDGLAMNGLIEVPALDLYAVRIEGSQAGTPLKIAFDVDSKAGKYDVAFDGGISIGRPQDGIGAFVAVKGALRTSDPNFTEFTLNGSSSIAMGVITINVNQIYVDGHIAKDPTRVKQNTLNVRGDMTVKALGIGINAAGALNYQHQQLVELMIRAGTSLNIVVASVSGNAQFNYCLGVLSALDAGKGSTCTPYDNYTNAKPAYRVGFFGSYRMLWWTKPYTWVAFDQRGTEGSPPPPPTNAAGLVDGGIPALTPNVMSAQQLDDQHDVVWPRVFGGDQFKTVMGKNVEGAPACDAARLGSAWPATAGNPATVNVDPNPSPQTCGLLVDWIGSGVRDPQRIQVTCTSTSCIGRDGPLRLKLIAGYDAQGQLDPQIARDALLAGLRTPPGVQPGDSQMTTPRLVAPDGGFLLQNRQGGVRLISGRTGETLWQVDSPDQKNAVTRWLTRDGLLQGRDADGSTAYSVGLKAPLDPDKYPVFLFVQDGLQVAQTGADGRTRSVWGVKPTGECFPTPGACK